MTRPSTTHPGPDATGPLFEPREINGRVIRWGWASGRVVGLGKHSQTFVSSEPTPYSAPNSVAVSSRVIVTTEFFVQQASGEEIPVQFTWEDIPLREGHRVTAVWGGSGRGLCLGLTREP